MEAHKSVVAIAFASKKPLREATRTTSAHQMGHAPVLEVQVRVRVQVQVSSASKGV